MRMNNQPIQEKHRKVMNFLPSKSLKTEFSLSCFVESNWCCPLEVDVGLFRIWLKNSLLVSYGRRTILCLASRFENVLQFVSFKKGKEKSVSWRHVEFVYSSIAERLCIKSTGFWSSKSLISAEIYLYYEGSRRILSFATSKFPVE